MTTVRAQEEESQPAAVDEQAPAGEQAPAAGQPQEAPGKIFMPMVRVVQLRGACEVNNPDVGVYAAAVENKVYPLGTRFRTGPDGSTTLVLSTQESVQVLGSTELTVFAPEKNPEGRVVRLFSGRIKTTLRENLPEGSFGVETPNAVCRNVEGRGEYALSADANAETLQIKTITGAARVEGPQYHIPALRAANTVDIQTSADRSFTRLTSVSGDFTIILDKGEEEPVSYGMSPKAVVKIWRENAPVGGRPVIAALVVSPTGIAKHRFAYAVGRPGVATGELVVPGTEEKAEEELQPLISPDAQQEQKAEEEEAGTGTEQ
jgi:hypothetical protein